MLRLLSLCSGVGGFELGIIAANLHQIIIPTQFVERDSFCQKVLSNWFPNIPIHSDLESYDAEAGTFDLICFGMPCQPHSIAGDMEGENDERNLWPHIYRLIQKIKPIGFILENVPGIRHSNKGDFFRGILRDIANAGYDAEWDTLSVKSLGGVHERERLFLIAYAQGDRCTHLRNAIAKQERADKAPSSLCSSTIPEWASTLAAFHNLDDGLSAWMGQRLLTHAQLPTALSIATIYAAKKRKVGAEVSSDLNFERKRIAPQLQAVGNSISPQVAAVAWRKLYGKLSTS